MNRLNRLIERLPDDIGRGVEAGLAVERSMAKGKKNELINRALLDDLPEGGDQLSPVQQAGTALKAHAKLSGRLTGFLCARGAVTVLTRLDLEVTKDGQNELDIRRRKK